MKSTRVNVFAKPDDKPWLFDDLKRHFGKAKVKGVEVIVTDFPIDESDVYVTIRTAEAKHSPHLDRTIACVHDLYEHDGMYLPDGHRGIVHQLAGLVLCHPQQRSILEGAGVDLKNKEIMERPLGALSMFSPGNVQPPKFTIGWVGRNYWRKRVEWFIEAVQGLSIPKDQFRIQLMGKDVEAPAEELRAAGFDCQDYPKENYPIKTYPDLYRQMNCLIITGVTEAGPLTLFESLSTGNPVIATKVGWAPILQKEDEQAITLVDTPAEITVAIEKLYKTQNHAFERRDQCSKVMKHWRLENWVEDVLSFSSTLALKKEEFIL